jgi:RHS repeat-associated protein
MAANSSHWKIRDLDGKVVRDYYVPGTTWNLSRDYIYRDGLLLAAVTPDDTLNFSLDHLGTPRVITGAGRIRLGFHHYMPFGEEWTEQSGAQEGEPMKFTGHERDAVPGATASDRLDFMHARYYDASVGRFLSIDPAGWSLTIPQSWNRYSYVLNNPLSFVDPTGRQLQCIPAADGKAAPFCIYSIDTYPKPIPRGFGGGGPSMDLPSVYQFPTRDDAARAAIQAICGKSVALDREFGGMIFESNGLYGYSAPIKGQAHDVSNAFGMPNLADAPNRMKMLPPPGVRMVGMYHTHGAESGRADEAISLNDRRSSYRLSLAGYVGTPSGRVLKYDPNEVVLQNPYKYDFGKSIGSVPCK